SFNHDDHLNPALQNGYPASPITEIVSVSEGDVLGNTDFTYTPTNNEAYCNDLFWWANISYVDGILHIRGKSYDPKPYGNITNIKVWIEDSDSKVILTDYRNGTETYYEGEWVTGEKLLHGRGGGLYYMPEHFEREVVWTSNGKFTCQEDVIKSFSEGFGFAFFSGHGSPGWWGDHFPGIPGNRRNAQVAGLVVSQVKPYFPFVSFPMFPMKSLSNTGKFPVVVVGGCHNSMFNVSLIPSILDLFLPLWMHTYGQLTPECWGWYLVKLPTTGAIATMGNTGYGWGWEGEWCTVGAGDGWITSEFFRQYGEKGHDVLGMAYSQTITSYIANFKEFKLHECYWSPDFGWDWIDEKTVQQWVLLGDPSLKIGGYP
ncbi:MAG: C25 family cysteine peptidase, partial [Candidatus Thermoplasmatota archaeon]|nr:C25 family cysteine peptidase [Candidatus Thermoplasmatota archaeon]